MDKDLRKDLGKLYRRILAEVGSYHYSIYDKEEAIPGDMFKNCFNQYSCVVAGTGALNSFYSFLWNNDEYAVAKGCEVVNIRLLKLDTSHDKPHYNAYDQILFPDRSGDIHRLVRKDAPDHYLEIAKISRLGDVADAYNLPAEKQGRVESYGVNGAKLHLVIQPFNNEPFAEE